VQRGGAVFRFSNCDTVGFVIWQDNKAVCVLTTDPAMDTGMKITNRKSRRFVGLPNKAVAVLQPRTVAMYIRFMRGVDLWWVATVAGARGCHKTHISGVATKLTFQDCYEKATAVVVLCYN